MEHAIEAYRKANEIVSSSSSSSSEVGLGRNSSSSSNNNNGQVMFHLAVALEVRSCWNNI